jgi:hypothetical protein
MNPLFDYLKADEENQLSLEQFGDLTENQTIQAPLKQLEESWGNRRKELINQPEEERD